MTIEFSTDALRDKKLMIAVPMYGGMCHGSFAKSMIELGMICGSHGIALQFFFLFNESLVQRARNYCVDEFLRSDCTHLLFIDADIGFSYKEVLTLLHLSSADTDYDIITAPYPKKVIAYEKIVKAVQAGITDPAELENYGGDFVFNLIEGVTSFRLDEPVEVMEAGTGFMMIQRSVFERFAKAYPSGYYKPDHARHDAFNGSRDIYAFFDCKIDDGFEQSEVLEIFGEIVNSPQNPATVEKIKEILGRKEKSSQRYLSEDYLFCRKAREIGIKIWMCPWTELTHAGNIHFKGSLPHLAQIDASPTVDEEYLNRHKK